MLPRSSLIDLEKARLQRRQCLRLFSPMLGLLCRASCGSQVDPQPLTSDHRPRGCADCGEASVDICISAHSDLSELVPGFDDRHWDLEISSLLAVELGWHSRGFRR